MFTYKHIVRDHTQETRDSVEEQNLVLQLLDTQRKIHNRSKQTHLINHRDYSEEHDEQPRERQRVL